MRVRCRGTAVYCLALLAVAHGLAAPSPQALSPSLAPALCAAPRNAYLHLPFCRRRCFYCDFPIVVVGDGAERVDAAAEAYVATLLREVRSAPRAVLGAAPLESVYFGGGTPSLTPPLLVHALVDELRGRYGLAPDAEVTLEMDPGTFDGAKLDAYIAAGVNRVSLGVQSFDEDLLVACGRAHGVAEIEQALDLVRQRKLRLSVDLISGLPTQTAASWRESLRLAAASGAGHVSVYDLQVEAGTKFARLKDAGTLLQPGDDEAASMFREASRAMGAAGFEHYEVSSYALQGQRSRHNSAYWLNSPFWGFGVGATSHVDLRRVARPRTLAEYGGWVSEAETFGWAAQQAQHGAFEDGVEAMQTRLMLALRTSDGVDVDALRAEGEIGAQAAIACLRAMQSIPKEWFDYTESRFKLTDPEGLLFSNTAIATVFAKLDPS